MLALLADWLAVWRCVGVADGAGTKSDTAAMLVTTTNAYPIRP